MPTRSKAKTRHSLDVGQPPLRMMCTWLTHLKKPATMTKKIQLRINLLRHSPSTGALNVSESHRLKDRNTGTGENSTPDDAENNEDPVGVTSEQEEQDNGQVSPDEHAIYDDPEDSNYLPLSEEEESLGSEDFIVPEAPLE